MSMQEKPKFINQGELYDLKPEEKVLFRVFSEADSTPERIDQMGSDGHKDLERLREQIIIRVKKMENGSTMQDVMSIWEELQGRVSDVRVVTARDDQTGHELNGFTIIGIPKEVQNALQTA